MKQPAASPGRAEKPQQQQLPAPPGLARLLLSKSRRGARSRRAPATSPMFVSRGRSRAAAAAAGADGEPSSPKVTCIGQVRMRKGKKKAKKAPTAPPTVKEEKARGYCRCLKKAFLCGGLFDVDRKHRRKGPPPEAERARRSPWVFSSRDVAVAAAPKPPDPASDRAEEEGEEDDEKSTGAFGSVERDEKADEQGSNDSGGKEEEEESEEGEAAELVSSATTTPPKNALLLMRCRSAPQNRSSPLTSRFAAGAAPSPVQEAADFAAESIAATPPRASPSPRRPDVVSPWASPSPRKPDVVSPWASPSRRKPAMLQSPRASPSPRKPDMVTVESDDEKRQEMAVSTQEDEEKTLEQDHAADDEEDEEEEDEAEEMRCSSARPLVLQRCKSEPATTAAAKMAAGAEGAPSGCFWANGGSSGRRRHAPQMSPAAAAGPVALTGH